jgi:hypothetical protein
MQKMSRILLLASLAAFGAGMPPLCAQNQYRSAQSLFARGVFAELSTAGKIIKTSEGEPKFLPWHEGSAEIASAITAQHPDLLVEAVFFLPRASVDSNPARESELAAIYGLLRSFSSLEGIEYYSASRKTMRTFYAESYRIADPTSRTRVPDPPPPKPGAIPASEVLFSYQRDLSFGANVYRYDFSTRRDAIAFTCVNQTRMSYGIMPVLAPKALATRVLIIRASDGILFYAASGADAPGIFRAKLNDSFGNRAEALFGWFSSRIKDLRVY